MKAGWKTVKLNDVCDIVKGRKPNLRTTPNKGDLPYLVARYIRGLEDPEYGSPVEKGVVTLTEADTVIICDGSNSGEIFTGLNGIMSSTMGKVVKKTEIYDPYLRHFLSSTFELFNGTKTGSAIPHLDKDAFRKLEIPLPPLAEQKRIVALLDEAFAGIDEAKANAEACQESAKSIFSNYLEAAFQKNGPGWAEVAISELCDVKHGYAFDGADFSSDVPEGNPLIVTPGNFTEDGKLCFNSKNSKRLRSKPPAEFQFNIGDLVVVMTDLSSQMKILGKPAFVETDNLLHNQRIGKLVFSSERVDRRLVYFFMMTQRYLKNIKVTSTGTMVKHTAPKRITSNLISFPENRARQLEVITKLDELRKETQCLAKTHEDKKRALIELKSSLLVQAFAGELTT